MISSNKDGDRKGMLEFDACPEDEDTKVRVFNNVKNNKLSILLCALLLILLVLLILFVVSYVEMRNCRKTLNDIETADARMCAYSDEANRVKLGELMTRIQEAYYEAFPEEIIFRPNVEIKTIQEKFRIHDPKPANLKRISDLADGLLKELIQLNPDLSKLKPREHKGYLQAKHFLESTFAYPSLKYSTGLWMLGPSSFCQEMVCNIGYSIYNSVAGIAPVTVEDVDQIIEHFKDINQSIHDNIAVLKMGIRKGMVRTQLECKAGLDAFQSQHKNISVNGAKGIKGTWYGQRFFEAESYQGVKPVLNEIFLDLYGLNVSDYLQREVEEYVGKPLEQLLVYLETDHYLACRPNDHGAGGLSALPLDVIYYNGSVVNGSSTDPTLPLCSGSNCRLSGAKAYASILGYFTTKDIDPLSVHNMGWENVRKIYPQMLDVARNITGRTDEGEAVTEFKKTLTNLSLSYFHDEPLPENETNEIAHKRCTSDETAKIFCPKRSAAMANWFRFAQMTMSLHDPNTLRFFYFTGERHSTPNCPIKLRVDYNPSSGAQSYDGSDGNCTRACHYNIPFFLEDLGPKYSEYSVNAHEARPGHHTQVQGLTENFGDICGGPESWLQHKTYYTAFTEGWALYAENPLIAQDTDIYEDNLMQKYGMLKWQMWRALRLIVDTGLHFKNYSRAKALELFDQYAWDSTDLSRKEVTRYQSNAGQATAYMIGQQDIWRLRNRTEEELQENFSLKEFHLQTLAQGSSPLAFLESHIGKYIECKLDSSRQYCDIVLNPTKSSRNLKRRSSVNTLYKSPPRRHHV